MTKFAALENLIYAHKPHALADDNRGTFQELYNFGWWKENMGEAPVIMQINAADSKAGVFRGLHFQFPWPMGKLVTCIRGHIWDVAVDIRKDSPTFCKWWAFELDGLHRQQLWVPEGFAHGYYAMAESTIVYATTNLYQPQYDHSLAHNDPAFGIKFPFTAPPALSEKDSHAPTLEQYQQNNGELPFIGGPKEGEPVIRL